MDTFWIEHIADLLPSYLFYSGLCVGYRRNNSIPLLALENLWPTGTNLFSFVNTEYPLFAKSNTIHPWIHSSSSELPNKADGSFSSKGHAIILKRTIYSCFLEDVFLEEKCKTQSVRDRKQIHIRKIQFFNELSEAWLCLAI